MKVRKWQKNMCCILAIILFVLGMNGDVVSVDASFLRSSNSVGTTDASLLAVDIGIEDPDVCTLNMLRTGSQTFINFTGGMGNWKNKVYLSAFFIGAYLLYLAIYQSAEIKEDGQLFLCRSVTINYIHQKDSGE